MFFRNFANGERYKIESSPQLYHYYISLRKVLIDMLINKKKDINLSKLSVEDLEYIISDIDFLLELEKEYRK
jgi:hypothetical protein